MFILFPPLGFRSAGSVFNSKSQQHAPFVSLNSLYWNGPVFASNPPYSRQRHIERMLIRALLNAYTSGIRPKN